MCGLSASFLFAMVSWLVESEAQFSGQIEKLVTHLRPTPRDSNVSEFN